MSTTELGPPAVAASEAGGADVDTSRDRARRRRRIHGWRRLISPIVLLVVWQLTNVVHIISSEKLPPPTSVVSEAYRLVVHNMPAYGTLQHALVVSTERWAVGFAFGAVVALALAVIAGLSRLGEETLDPLMQMLRTLPLFGLVPVFIVWFGIGDLPKILLIAIAAVIPLYLNAFSGIRGVDGRLLELSRALGLSRRERLIHIVFPGALAETLVGLRQSLGVAWLALVVAEQINASTGLGAMINQAENFNANNVIFVALLTYTILGLLTDWIVRLAERRALAWRDAGAVR